MTVSWAGRVSHPRWPPRRPGWRRPRRARHPRTDLAGRSATLLVCAGAFLEEALCGRSHLRQIRVVAQRSSDMPLRQEAQTCWASADDGRAHDWVAGARRQPTLGATDAGARHRSRSKACVRDRLAAALAHAVGTLLQPAHGQSDLIQVRHRLVDHCTELGSLERDRGALGVVLVVGVRINRRRSQCLEGHSQVCTPSFRGAPFLVEPGQPFLPFTRGVGPQATTASTAFLRALGWAGERGRASSRPSSCSPSSRSWCGPAPRAPSGTSPTPPRPCGGGRSR